MGKFKKVLTATASLPRRRTQVITNPDPNTASQEREESGHQTNIIIIITNNQNVTQQSTHSSDAQQLGVLWYNKHY